MAPNIENLLQAATRCTELDREISKEHYFFNSKDQKVECYPPFELLEQKRAAYKDFSEALAQIPLDTAVKILFPECHQ